MLMHVFMLSAPYKDLKNIDWALHFLTYICMRLSSKFPGIYCQVTIIKQRYVNFGVY